MVAGETTGTAPLSRVPPWHIGSIVWPLMYWPKQRGSSFTVVIVPRGVGREQKMRSEVQGGRAVRERRERPCCATSLLCYFALSENLSCRPLRMLATLSTLDHGRSAPSSEPGRRYEGNRPTSTRYRSVKAGTGSSCKVALRW